MGVVFERNGKNYVVENGKVSLYNGAIDPFANSEAEKSEQGGFVDALQGMGWAGAYAGGDALRAAGLESLGKSITDRSAQGMDENALQTEGFSGTGVANVLGQASGNLALGAAGYAVPVVGPLLSRGLMGVNTLAQSYAGMRRQQEAAGETERGRAFAASIPIAAIETAMGVEGKLLSLLGKEGLKLSGKEGLEAVANMGVKGLAKEGAKQGAVENFEELLQMPFEQYGARGMAGLETDALIEGAKDVAMNAPNVFVGAGLLGGGMQTYQRSRARDSLKTLNDSLLQEETAKEEAAQLARAEQEAFDLSQTTPQATLDEMRLRTAMEENPYPSASPWDAALQQLGGSRVGETPETPAAAPASEWGMLRTQLEGASLEDLGELTAPNVTRNTQGNPTPITPANNAQEVEGWEDELAAQQAAPVDAQDQALMNLGGAAPQAPVETPQRKLETLAQIYSRMPQIPPTREEVERMGLGGRFDSVPYGNEEVIEPVPERDTQTLEMFGPRGGVTKEAIPPKPKKEKQNANAPQPVPTSNEVAESPQGSESTQSVEGSEVAQGTENVEVPAQDAVTLTPEQQVAQNLAKTAKETPDEVYNHALDLAAAVTTYGVEPVKGSKRRKGRLTTQLAELYGKPFPATQPVGTPIASAPFGSPVESVAPAVTNPVAEAAPVKPKAPKKAAVAPYAKQAQAEVAKENQMRTPASWWDDVYRSDEVNEPAFEDLNDDLKEQWLDHFKYPKEAGVHEQKRFDRIAKIHNANAATARTSKIVDEKALDVEAAAKPKQSKVQAPAQEIDLKDPETRKKLDEKLVPYRVWDEETNSWQATEVSALKALEDIQQDETALKSFIKCLKGG